MVSTEKNIETLGERLKNYITAQYGKGKQGVFAKAVRLKDSQVSDYITGRTTPGGEVLQRFAEAGMNTNWLLTGRGSMTAPDMSPVGGRPPREQIIADLDMMEDQLKAIREKVKEYDSHKNP